MSGSHSSPSTKPRAQMSSELDPSLHAHKKGDAQHTHSKQVSNQNLLLIALILTLGFAGVEGAAAYFANSLAIYWPMPLQSQAQFQQMEALLPQVPPQLAPV